MVFQVDKQTAGAAAATCAGLLAVQWWVPDGWPRVAGSLVSVLPLLVIAVRRPLLADTHPLVEDACRQAEQQRQQYQQALQDLEVTRSEALAALQQRADELQQREERLTVRFARFHEFVEYPAADVMAELSPEAAEQLGEQDRQVRQLLEQEAERVYEKIRSNGYLVDGRVQLEAIRDEAVQLIRRVAQIYRPDSENPLLEVSLEQIARAASRIWLHLLVLLEQLPLNVQSYSMATLYGWIRRAVIGYGVYQKASPWLKYATRGLYAGRLVAASNPLSLGAWWAASELGRRGATKLVEQTIDRQAVALLQQLITVIGVEAAGIYGTGFRQRDPAWILGTELVELIAAFPASGESLRAGLQKVTGLPLLSEYDRIYLYRCLAHHRASGLLVGHSAVLSREQRELIADELEKFYGSHVHGGTEQSSAAWRAGVEDRLGLRLKLQQRSPVVSEQTELLTAAAESLCGFLQLQPELTDAQWRQAAAGLQILHRLPEVQRTRLLQQRPATDAVNVQPPPLDPGSELVDLWLQDLACCAVVGAEPAAELEQMAIEAATWFRRSSADMQRWLDAAWKVRLRWEAVDPQRVESLDQGVARLVFLHRRAGEKLVFCYGGLQRIEADVARPLSDAWLVGLQDSAGWRRVVVLASEESRLIWQAAAPLQITRIRGVFLDDARLEGGEWVPGGMTESGTVSGVLQVSGSLRGGRYSSWFAPLLAWAGQHS